MRIIFHGAQEEARYTPVQKCCIYVTHDYQTKKMLLKDDYFRRTPFCIETVPLPPLSLSLLYHSPLCFTNQQRRLESKLRKEPSQLSFG